jgi:hypothetical protein
MDAAYEHRTVAFVDILGFADLVRRSATDTSFLARLSQALRIVEFQGRAWAAQSASAGAGTTPEDTDFRSQVFSDCIVLSQRGKMAAPMFISVAQLAMALLDLGVLVRGGITEGSLYHDDTIVFGPALIDAYHLESKAARFPRVLVSDEVIATSRQNLVKFTDRGPEGAYFASEFLRRDSDRLFHVDHLTTALLSPGSVIGADEPELRRRIQRAGAMALSEFSEAGRSTDVRAKWGWFLDYFNDFARIRTSHLSELKVEVLTTDDDEMDPVLTWEGMRAAYYRNRLDGG